MQLKQQAIESVTPANSRNRQRLALHRRVGLFSMGCLLLGGGWLSTQVLPGFQKAIEHGQVQTASLGWLRFIPGVPAPKPSPSVPTSSQSAPEEPAVGTIETVLLDAPVGTALQGLLASARYTSVCDPGVVSNVTYTNTGNPKPFWEIIGRVIGAAPEPSAHVVPYWDAYRILPRTVVPMGRDIPNASPPAPVMPVPLTEGHASHRMAGYILLTPNGSRPPIRAAILETRVPGDPPFWRVLFVGDTIQRKSAVAIARETDPRTNVDIAPVVEAITAEHLILRGGGDKRLLVPLSKTGVADIFGFRFEPADSAASQQQIPSASYQRGNGLQQSPSDVY